MGTRAPHLSTEQDMAHLIACPSFSTEPWVKSAALQALDGHQEAVLALNNMWLH